MKVSVGITAYNEEANIGTQLEAVLLQDLPIDVELLEVIVVASGCTDRTEDIVQEFQQKSRVVKLLIQEERHGISSAYNEVFNFATGDVIVLVNADVILERRAIRYLVQPFKENFVGATFGKAIPVNDPEEFLGYVCCFFI